MAGSGKRTVMVPRDASETVELLLRRTALRGEAALSLLRVVFCGAILARFVAIGAHVNDEWGTPRSTLTLAATGVAVASSAAFWWQHTRGRVGSGWLGFSVAVDAAVCFSLLLTNVLYPGPAYRGILLGPDVAAVLLVSIAGGLRLSVRVAAVGAVLNTAAVLALITLDRAVGRPLEYALGTAALWLILAAGAGATGVLGAWWTRSLALRGAIESVRHERAQRSLEALLQGHHDAHSLVSSLTLSAGLLERGVRSDAELSTLARQLCADLLVLASCVRQVRETAEGELLISLEPAPVELSTEVPQITQRLATWLGLSVELKLDPASRAMVAGGEAGLARVLTNLLTNAKKGDGRRGAQAILLSVRAAGEMLELVVDDDGPGLGEALPGVGLSVVRGILAAHGGQLTLEPSHLGGLRARLLFPQLKATSY